MNILILGSGGREHAMAWKVRQSPLCTKLFLAPGNAGTAAIATNLPVKVLDFEGIKNAVISENIDFVIVGPDDPLALGIVDFFKNDAILKSIKILGPEATAARLESSKDFAKSFMLKHDIPTAVYKSFLVSEKEAALVYIQNHALPVVIKADGLAAGKGVAVCTTHEEAVKFVQDIWEAGKFGKAGDKIVVESFLKGIELSVFILTDGERYVLLPEAKDYKRIGEGDTGPNTGGMGSVSPVPFADPEFMKKIKDRIIDRTISGLQQDGINFQGFIFFGLINVDGDPFVIEYNARMGDPETQVVFPRIKSDLVPFLIEVADGNLSKTELDFDSKYAVSVIAVSNGYPDAYDTQKQISGLENITGSEVFHAGTVFGKDQKILTSGGRVLAITSMADTLVEAQTMSYKNISEIDFDGMVYRTDIGKDLM